jgi:hypothetical protein
MDVTGAANGRPQFGATVPIASIKHCVVYDADSGRIHHHHSVLTLAGGAEPAPAQIARDALAACASRRTPVRGNLHVLHVEHTAITPGNRYRVNDGALCLIPR